MTSLDSVWQPSVIDLARAGNFRALTYWINTYLLPQGIHARVENAQAGCLQIFVEFRQAVDKQRTVQSICHQIWKLNSDEIDGVRIVARCAGQPDILWKESVRIVTPANQQRRVQGVSRKPAIGWLPGEKINFKVLRALLVVGTAVASFTFGCWFGYRAILNNKIASTPIPTEAVTLSQQTRPKEVRAALETIPVKYHNQVTDPTDPIVTLMFAGDVTLSDSFADVAGNDYKWAFAQMDLYRQVDVAMVNLENPLTRSETIRPGKEFNFKADPESVQVLTEGGVDIVNLANNHTMDYEAPGLEETLQTLDGAGIRYVGAGRDIKEARRPEIIEVKGQRIAYLGYYDPESHAAAEQVAGTNPLLEAQIAEDISAIRNQVDWIIVNYHWGAELADYPADWQRQLAHFTIDQGADVVVGHHPHVLQGAEIYKGRPIAYSLGNFIFGGNSRSDYDTAVLKVSLKGQKMKVEFLPVEVRQYQPTVVKNERGDEILNYIEEISHIFERPMTSPMILNTRRTESIAAAEGANSAPALENAQFTTGGENSAPALVKTPNPSPAPAQKSNSSIKVPVFPGDIILRNYAKELEVPQNEEQLEASPETEPAAKDEFINTQPFITQPFIPNLPSPPSENQQSQLPAIPPPSFNLSNWKQKEAETLTLAAEQMRRRKTIQLPVFA
ncbi:CapA family protein [Microcoleus sp. FACHB-68]|uniref:CapA family protein n=1 Tax=Microcoleus sp. FACHB-68 TaxID=2692826 RepID=UPI0016867752|nr:CapA family protein [Microcoleus sp. FACHB-68]MBD1938936.1 CapA family protein [Microcoleus sp. FACHB-68]